MGPVNIRELCDQVVKMMDPSIKLKQLNLVASYSFNTEVIEGDALRLKQILINLFSNAVKFTPAGGKITLQVLETKSPPELLISVTDTGRGIAPENHERVFLEFEQGEHVSHSGGTGLGLSIARRLAVMHGGNISLVSDTGRGSTFTVRLPIRIPSEPVHAPEVPFAEAKVEVSKPKQPNSALILAVDDSPDNLEILYYYLSSEGYRVAQASSGEEALAKVAARRPNLILMDVKMSGMDGLETIRRLKSDPATKDIPVISLTAFAGSSDVERCHAAGAADYVSKPINFDELAAKISRQLSFAKT
jgi:CheY-like chemotaxis protein/anti-sigma regulatory factor (Ser/Thr protein kinase)